MTSFALPRSPFKAWLLAVRLRTLVASVVPVAVGTALAAHHGAMRLDAAVAALIGALLIQVGTNLANDYHDYRRGADGPDRVGPPRVSQLGLIAPLSVLSGAFACFAAAMLVGAYLVAIGGWPILTIGLVSIAAGYAYTGGPYPLGYHGLGDLFVLVFFGFVAVGGTYFVQSGELSPAALAAAIPVGAFGVALLAVNNVRDRTTDARANKRTLVVRFGERFGRAEYAVMVALAFASAPLMWLAGLSGPLVMLSWIALPLAVAPLRGAFQARGAALNGVLAATARLQLVFGLLFAFGLSR